MTAAPDTNPLTASLFLFPDQDTGQALADALDSHDVLRSKDVATRLATQVVRQAAEHQVGVVADGLLSLDLGDLVIAGWRKQADLAAAAERTAANPNSPEVVELATHRISSTHRPYVELLLNEQHLTNVNFELKLEYRIKDRTPLTPVVDLLFVRRAMADALRRTVTRFANERKAEIQFGASQR